MTSKAIPRLDEDDRLLPLLSHLSMGFLAGISNEYTDSSLIEHGQELNASMVDALVTKHAPMCMRNLNQSLKEKNHLKHFSRQQFGLFLKEIGLPLEEAIIFWRMSFKNHTLISSTKSTSITLDTIMDKKEGGSIILLRGEFRGSRSTHTFDASSIRKFKLTSLFSLCSQLSKHSNQ